MPSPQEAQRVSYEAALRVIGRHLDAEPAYNVSVLEVEDGFAVRSYPARHKIGERVSEFSWERLRDLMVFHHAGRDCGPRGRRHQGVWNSVPSGHEDFFRALGFLLDSQVACGLSLDEVPDGIAVTFMRPSEDGSRTLQKFHTVYDREQIATMRKDALQRRRSARMAIGAS